MMDGYTCVITENGGHMIFRNEMKSFLLLIFLALICSCGDESTKVVENRTLDYESYDAVDDLPECTDENQGQLAWVVDESQLRICADEKWSAMKSKDSVPKLTLSCWTKMSKDSSGYTVICNGDSIGFVRNGVLIDNRKDNECSVLFVDGDTLEIVCDSLVSILVKDSEGNLSQHEVDLDSEQIALDLENIEGVSQKGPFVTGSEVVVYELQNGRTLKQTGKSFQGNITNDNGAFNVRSVKIASQYAYLVAKGVYLNEVSGQKSDAQIQLSAITDLRNRNNVNVNILTHLEYERVVNLVTKKKMTVANAKKQAQKEIFNVFHVNSEKFVGGSEDFSIGGTGEEDAALLAISIMLQKEDNTADFSKRINALSSSIADSGSCEPSTLFDIAEWASRADSLNFFPRFSEHVRDFGLSVKVPDFEKYVRNFWNKEFDLGKCDTLGKIVAANRTELRSSASRFICEEKYGVRSWRYATVTDIDVYGKKPAADGSLYTAASGNVYVYDSVLAIANGAGWRPANVFEQAFTGCRMELNNKITSSAELYSIGGCYDSDRRVSFYRCDGENREWVKAENCFIVDTYGWGDVADGTVKFSDSVDVDNYYRKCYLFDSLDGGWRTVERMYCDSYSDIGGCTRAREGKFFKNNRDEYYMCTKNLEWQQFYKDFAEDVWNQECKTWVIGSVDTNNRYVCENGEWREAQEMEMIAGGPCFDQDTISYSADSAYVCYTGIFVDEFWRNYGSGWKKATVLDNPQIQKDYLNEALTYDSIVDARDGRIYKTIRIGEDTWTAENLLYFDRMTMNNEKSCYGDNSSGCEMWREYYWPIAMNISGLYLSSSANNLISEKHQGSCPEGWHIPSVAESESLLAAAGSFEALFSAKKNLIKSQDFEEIVNNWLCPFDEIPYVRGSNASGFSAITGAKPRSIRISFDEEVAVELPLPKICWWTSEEVSDTQAKAFCASIDDDFTMIETRSKEEQLPVRCVKDKEGDE